MVAANANTAPGPFHRGAAGAPRRPVLERLREAARASVEDGRSDRDEAAVARALSPLSDRRLSLLGPRRATLGGDVRALMGRARPGAEIAREAAAPLDAKGRSEACRPPAASPTIDLARALVATERGGGAA